MPRQIAPLRLSVNCRYAAAVIDLQFCARAWVSAEPEEVLDFLREYHGALGPLVSQFEGTLDQFSSDGIMVFFNDPVPIPDAAERAVKMAIAMREAAETLTTAWRPEAACSGSALVSLKATQRWDRLALLTAPGIQRSARYAISPPDFALKPRMARSLLVSASQSRSKRRSRLRSSASLLGRG
jgi:hypothetical protein